MKRVLIPLAITVGLLGTVTHADTTQDRIVSELRDQGFTRIEISRTLLGRTRIVAESPEYEREIVLNPASGVILRDFLKQLNGDGDSGASLAGRSDEDGGSRSSSDSSGSGSASSGGDDDDSDDDNDDSDSNSGSDSGSSGSSGNSDDDSDDDDSGDDSDSGDNSGSGDDGGDSDSDDDNDDDD